MKTTGNTVFITGGGSGIGRGLAEAFHKLGNQVIIAGRREAVLSKVAAANPGMQSVTLDTSKAESITRVAAEMAGQFPALNVIINNAGVQRVHEFAVEGGYDDTAAQEEINTNISGVLRMTQAFLPHLRLQPAATIVNVSSGLAFVPMARFPVYCATKAFVHCFSMSLRHQLRNTTVKVLELIPPWVKTDLDVTHPPAMRPDGMSPMPLDQFIAAAMTELAGDEHELKVAGAKYLYSAGVGDRLYSTFNQMNE
ncbi:MAG TPA: SDR family NAD(P)-dependent oxidoreductase [Acidisarcina sp.]